MGLWMTSHRRHIEPGRQGGGIGEAAGQTYCWYIWKRELGSDNKVLNLDVDGEVELRNVQVAGSGRCVVTWEEHP